MTNSCGIIAHAQRCLTWRCRSVKKSPCNDFDWAHEFSKQPTSSGVVKREKHCHSSQVTFWKIPSPKHNLQHSTIHYAFFSAFQFTAAVKFLTSFCWNMHGDMCEKGRRERWQVEQKKKEASEWQNDYWHDDTVEKWCWWLSERMNGPGGVTEMLTFTSINSFSSSTWASHPRRSFGCISKNILKLSHPESQQVLPRLKFMNIWDRHHCNVRLGAALLSRWSRKFEFPDARVWREHETCESQGLKLIFTLYVDERWCISWHR